MKQKATISSINNDNITLGISCGDACAACSAKSLCGTNSSKTIVVKDDGQDWAVGQEVIVYLDSDSGLRAVVLAYVLPTMLIVAGLLVMQAFGLSELWSGVAAIGLAVLYFVLIKVFGLGKRSISVKIKKDDE